MKIKNLLYIVFAFVIIYGCKKTETGTNIAAPPFIIDSHIHYVANDDWERSFLDIYSKHNAMGCILVSVEDLDNGPFTGN